MLHRNKPQVLRPLRISLQTRQTRNNRKENPQDQSKELQDSECVEARQPSRCPDCTRPRIHREHWRCRTIHLAKIKNPWKEPAAPESGCKHMGGESDLPTNPERAALERTIQINHTVRETCRSGRINAIQIFTSMDLR